MSRVASGYKRQKNEFYSTPNWVVTEGLAPHLPIKGQIVWEPAAGDGRMVRAIQEAGAKRVYASDIEPKENLNQPGLFDDGSKVPKATKRDFLADLTMPARTVNLIVTNPPYGEKSVTAVAFMERGLMHVRKHGVILALLFPIDFSCAQSRRPFFADCPEYAMKIELTRRINWFEGTTGQSEHHAWYIWGRKAVASLPVVVAAP